MTAAKPVRPASQAEYDRRRAALNDLMLTALRSDLLEAAGLTEEEAFRRVAAEARCLAACTKGAAAKRDLLETARTFED